MPTSRSDFPIFSSNCFKISDLTFRSLASYELISMQCRVGDMKVLFCKKKLFDLFFNSVIDTYNEIFITSIPHFLPPALLISPSTRSPLKFMFSLYSFDDPLSPISAAPLLLALCCNSALIAAHCKNKQQSRNFSYQR